MKPNRNCRTCGRLCYGRQCMVCYCKGTNGKLSYRDANRRRKLKKGEGNA